MDILMTEINGMVRETDMNIKEYAESTVDLIDKMDQMELIRSSYFTEAKKDKEDDNALIQQKSMLEKIKQSIVSFFDRLIHLIPNLIKKIKTSSRVKRVEEMGKHLDKMSKIGVNLGKVKVNIPNIQVYDSFVMQLISEYVIKFDATEYSKVLGALKGPIPRIDGLINNLNMMAGELSSGNATKNNINAVLKKIYNRHPLYQYAQRTSRGSAQVADQVRRNNAYFDMQTKQAVKNSNTSNAGDLSNPRYGDKKFGGERKNIYESANTYTEAIELSGSPNIAYNYDKVRDIGGAPLAFIYIGAESCAKLKQFFSSAPSKVKAEEITVRALYKRTMDMKLDVMESRFIKNINESRAAILKGMTLEEFANSDDKDKKLVKAAQKLCELLNAYFRFEVAELNYYYRILIEVDSKLSIRNIKKSNGAPLLTKESTDESSSTDNHIIDMEEFMDLESFMATE